MSKGIQVKPRGRVAQKVDEALVPVMRFLSGAPDEAPQETHVWNNHHLSPSDAEYLDRHMMVFEKGDRAAVRRKGLLDVRFHLQSLGGWKKYVVLEPLEYSALWHVGWCGEGFAGVSRIPIEGPVRLLIGPHDTWFFGLSGGSQNNQIPILKIGEGVIGTDNKFKKTRLL